MWAGRARAALLVTKQVMLRRSRQRSGAPAPLSLHLASSQIVFLVKYGCEALESGRSEPECVLFENKLGGEE